MLNEALSTFVEVYQSYELTDDVPEDLAKRALNFATSSDWYLPLVYEISDVAYLLTYLIDAFDNPDDYRLAKAIIDRLQMLDAIPDAIEILKRYPGTGELIEELKTLKGGE